MYRRLSRDSLLFLYFHVEVVAESMLCCLNLPSRLAISQVVEVAGITTDKGNSMCSVKTYLKPKFPNWRFGERYLFIRIKWYHPSGKFYESFHSTIGYSDKILALLEYRTCYFLKISNYNGKNNKKISKTASVCKAFEIKKA